MIYIKNLVSAVSRFVVTSVAIGAISGFALAQNAIESLTAGPSQAGKISVRVGLKESLTALPVGFSVSNPSRIAIDLVGVTNALGKSSVELGEGDLRSASVVEVSGKTRLVFNTARPLGYTLALESKALIVTLDGAAGANREIATATATKFAEAGAVRAVAKQAIREVDFRRGTSGEGRVVIDLPSANTGIDIRTQGKTVVVDFIDVTLPRQLAKKFDATDYGTPIRGFEMSEQAGNVRLSVEPRGTWEYSAYQTDTQFILEVKAVQEDSNKLVPSVQQGYGGEKLSLNFQNIEVRAVLQVIADHTGLNIITSDSVGGSLTLRLKDVPWDQALDIILQSKGLSKRKNGNVVLIAPTDELTAKEKILLEASQQINDLEPLRTESFTFSYARADDISKMLNGGAGGGGADRAGSGSQRLLSKRGTAVIDPRTNTLFIQDTPSKLEELRKFFVKLDVPLRQVQIEARVVIADDKFSRQLGARFGSQAGFSSGKYNIGQAGSISSSSPLAAGTSLPTGASESNLNVNLPVAGGGQLGLTIFNLGSGNLVNLELSALETDGRGKVVSSPRVITAEKQKAEILQGTELPYLTSSSSGGTTVAYKIAALSLNVTPRITPEDTVILDLEVRKDTVGQIYNGVPSIDTKKVITQVIAANGDTIVLGGVYEQEIRTDVDKIPFLGDIPFVGNLFKRTSRRDTKVELLIFITPKILKDILTIK